MSVLPSSIAWSSARSRAGRPFRSRPCRAARSRSLTCTGIRLDRPPRSSASVNWISRGWPPMVRIKSRRCPGSRSRSAGSRKNIRRSSVGDSGGTATGTRNRSGPGTGYRQVTSSAPGSAAAASPVSASPVAGSRNASPPTVRFCSKSSSTTSSRTLPSSWRITSSFGTSSRPGSASMAAAAPSSPAGSAAVPAAARTACPALPISAAGLHRPSCTATSQPSSASRAITRPASAVLPIPPTPVSTTPVAAPKASTARPVRRSTPAASRSSARRPISSPTGSSRTPRPPGRLVATISFSSGAAGSISGPSPSAVTRVTTPNSGTGARSFSRGRVSSASTRARASARPAVSSGWAASCRYSCPASIVA